jgi:uncharacterized integral membrane protein
MIRLLLAVLVTVAVVTFAMVNTHMVVLSFVFGPPVKVRLIFLLMSAFLLGMIFLGFLIMAWRLRDRGRASAAARHEESLVRQ